MGASEWKQEVGVASFFVCKKRHLEGEGETADTEPTTMMTSLSASRKKDDDAVPCRIDVSRRRLQPLNPPSPQTDTVDNGYDDLTVPSSPARQYGVVDRSRGCGGEIPQTAPPIPLAPALPPKVPPAPAAPAGAGNPDSDSPASPSPSPPPQILHLSPDIVAPEPHRLYRDPSEALSALYGSLEDVLAEQRDAVAEVVEARRNLDDARRWLFEAENRCRKCADDVRSRTEMMWEGELVEPGCYWNGMREKFRRFREKHGPDANPAGPSNSEARRKYSEKRKREKRRERERLLKRREEEKRRWGNNRRGLEESKIGGSPKAKTDESCTDGGGGSGSGGGDGDGKREGEDTNEEGGEESLDDDLNGNDSDDDDYEHAELGAWLTSQRTAYKAGRLQSLSPHRVRSLEQLGMIWDLPEAKWTAMYAELVRFKEIHGHTNIPPPKQSDEKLSKLYKWAERQRTDRRGRKGRPRMKPERVRLLEDLGFRWAEAPQTHTWKDRYDDLCKFRELHGHCNVPRAYRPDPSLGRWVHAQRASYFQMKRGPKKRRNMPDERRRMLEDIGFEWRRLNGRGVKRKL